MKDVVNTKIKFREPFRPFAPSVVLERAEEYFVLPDAARHHPARFMLDVVGVRADKQAVIPAGTHVDGTGRVAWTCSCSATTSSRRGPPGSE